MKNDKLYIFILIVIAIVLGALIFVYFNISREEGFGLGSANNNSVSSSNNTHSNSSSSNTNVNISDITSLPVKSNEKLSLEAVTDYTEFFNVNNILNTFYTLVANKNSKSILNVFDPDYIAKNDITIDNLTQYVNSKYDEITFYAKTMYRKGSNAVRYYFVNGELQNYDFAEEMLHEVENISILVIIDFNNDCFSVLPIANDGDLFTFAQNYMVSPSKRLKRNENNDYNEQTYNDEIISINYIRYFQNMLYLNTPKAYDMLSDDSKAKYPTLEDFSDNLDSIYNNITSRIKSYGTKGENGRRTYSVIMYNDIEIIFEEKTIMNFKVTLAWAIIYGFFCVFL